MKNIKSKAQKRKLQKETYQNLYLKKKEKKREKKNLGVDVPSSSAPKIGHAKRRVQTSQQRLKATMKKQEQRGGGVISI
jgi:hypothetical protein